MHVYVCYVQDMTSEEEEEEELVAGPSTAGTRKRTRQPTKTVKYTFSDSEESVQESSDDDLFEL